MYEWARPETVLHDPHLMHLHGYLNAPFFLIRAAIYFAVIALAHLEIGIVAILIGYMVGYAIRKGARGRGGLRFQVMAVALTYLSVAIAYTPLAVKQVITAGRQAPPAASAKTGADENQRLTEGHPLHRP